MTAASPPPGVVDPVPTDDSLTLLPVLAAAVPELTVWVVDADRRFVLCAGSWLARRGLTAADVVGRRVADTVLPGFGSWVDDVLDQVLAGRPFSGEVAVDYRLDDPSGRACWVVDAAPVRGPDGAPMVLWTARDVVRDRAADARRVTSEARFDAVLDAAPTPMALLRTVPVTDGGGLRVCQVNSAFCDLFGVPARRVRGADLAQAVADGLAGPEVLDLVERSADPGMTAVDSWIRHVDGTAVRVSAAISTPIRVTDGTGPTHTEFIVVLRDVSAERALHEALTQALEGERRVAAHLRQLDAIRGDFVAAVSHELRTPMTGILGNVEMLLDGDAGPLTPMQALMLATVEQESQRLRRLIEDLLSTARIEAGTLDAPTCVEVDLAAVAGAAADEVAGQFTRRSQRLVRVLSGSAWVSGDAGQLRSVAAELLSNASKVSPAGTAVTLSCATEGPAVVLRVSDSGPGIAAEDLPHVFERFFRTAHAGDRALPGTGLGLSLVHHTVTAHGGVVAATSSGEGAVLTVRLPAVRPSVPAPRPDHPRSPA